MRAYYRNRGGYPIQIDCEYETGDGGLIMAISIEDAQNLINDLNEAIRMALPSNMEKEDKFNG